MSDPIKSQLEDKVFQAAMRYYKAKQENDLLFAEWMERAQAGESMETLEPSEEIVAAGSDLDELCQLYIDEYEGEDVE